MSKIGFIGMGNMGYAMLKGMMKVFDKSELLFTAKTENTLKRVSEETGIAYAQSNADVPMPPNM